MLASYLPLCFSLCGPANQACECWSSNRSVAFVRSTITPGNSFCGSISKQLASTPDGKGNRFQPQPAAKNSAGGYDLTACAASMSF